MQTSKDFDVINQKHVGCHLVIPPQYLMQVPTTVTENHSAMVKRSEPITIIYKSKEKFLKNHYSTNLPSLYR